MPEFKKVKAIDVVPLMWGVWSSIGDGKPFVNPICHAAWASDGRIVFGLDSHNFYFAKPEEELELVPLDPSAGSERAVEEHERWKTEGLKYDPGDSLFKGPRFHGNHALKSRGDSPALSEETIGEFLFEEWATFARFMLSKGSSGPEKELVIPASLANVWRHLADQTWAP